MAGIGWKLERMLERDTLGSTLQAYLTGVAVTSAPWLLTTAVLVTLRVETTRPGHFVAIDDPLPAIFEAVNPAFQSQQIGAAGAGSYQ